MTAEEEGENTIGVLLVGVSDCIEGCSPAHRVSDLGLYLMIEEGLNGMRGTLLGGMHQNVFAVLVSDVVDIC